MLELERVRALKCLPEFNCLANRLDHTFENLKKGLCRLVLLKTERCDLRDIVGNGRQVISSVCSPLIELFRPCYTGSTLSLTSIDRGDLGQLAPRKKLLKSC